MSLSRVRSETAFRSLAFSSSSSFRDWASEQTSFPHETCEQALSHVISNKAEAAYRRGDQFEKRRLLMEAWSSFCLSGKTANP